MKRLPADEYTALGGPEPHNLVGVDDAYEWNGNQKGPRIGTYYTILRAVDVEKVRVLVRDTAPAVDPATFQSMTVMQFPQVCFDRLTATISVNSRTQNLSIYAEANAIKLVTPQKQ